MPKIINIAICDDEKIQVELLEKYVRSWAAKNNILVKINRFYSGESFEFIWSMDKKYNILLLDIEMKGQLYISITNSVGGEVKKFNLEYISTKFGMNHGFGLKRVDSIVTKYHGFINRQNEEGVFATEVILPI